MLSEDGVASKQPSQEHISSLDSAVPAAPPCSTTQAASSRSGSRSPGEAPAVCGACGEAYHAECMDAAFAAARAALTCGEVAVGCVLVNPLTHAVVASGHNRTNRDGHALGHAEFDAVSQLPDVARLQDLSQLHLYVTVEPCIMCASMLALNRIGHVFYGCSNPRFGGNGGVLEVHGGAYCSSGGWRADDAVQLLQTFYGQENASAPDHKRRRKESDPS